jgi:hypothetical protein
MMGLNPSRTGGFPIEVKTAAPTHTAVTRTGTFEGRLRRPCERTLFNGKEGERGDDLVNSEEGDEKALLWSPIIRRCMFILHGRMETASETTARAAKNQRAPTSSRCILPVSLLPIERAVKR